jgi:hypothetical protein
MAVVIDSFGCFHSPLHGKRLHFATRRRCPSARCNSALEAAVRAFEERGVEHSTITDLPPFGIAVLPFKDPDGVALELTAPL